jgi:hypothetical protein
MAAGYGFRRIIGVEYSRELHTTALENVKRCGMEDRIEAVCADAIEYELPREPLVIFLYHPFDATVMRPFVNHVESSLREVLRMVWIFYLNPRHREAWDDSVLFRRVAEGGDGDGDGYVIWRSVEEAKK